MKGFPWRFAVYFLAAVYLFVDLYACGGPLARRFGATGGGGEGPAAVAARVYGRPVTRLELEEAMRDHLFRRGEEWEALGPEARKQTRWLVLETLVNERLVRAFRTMNGLDSPPAPEARAREVEQLRKQFEEAGEFEGRLAWRKLDETQLAAGVQAALEDQAWIEEKIRPRLVEITEAEVRAWYERHGAELAAAPSFRAAHIYLTRHDKEKPDREPEIRAIHAELAAGTRSFEALAAACSEDERNKKHGGDLGWFSRERMPREMIAIVEKLDPEELSAPFLSPLGWHIVKLLEKQPGGPTPFDAVRAEIRAFLVDERRAAAVKALVAELRERSLNPKRFIHYFPGVIESSAPAARE